MRSLQSALQSASRFLAEEIQRVKSKDSPARGTTYILLEDRVAKGRMKTMYNGGGLGWKGTGAVEGLEWASKVYEDVSAIRKNTLAHIASHDFLISQAD